jgi:hypothetical protein
MLINHNTKQYWWGPPRTASREVSSWLRSWGWEEIGGHHYIQIVDGYELFVSCRNPYSRAVSWWIMRTKHEEPLIDQDGNKIWMIDDSTFKEWIMNPNEYVNGRNSHESSVRVIIENNLEFTPIRLENIYEDMSKFGYYVDCGPKYWGAKTTKEILSYGEYYDSELAQWVWETFKDEFELFGYKKDSWMWI